MGDDDGAFSVTRKLGMCFFSEYVSHARIANHAGTRLLQFARCMHLINLFFVEAIDHGALCLSSWLLFRAQRTLRPRLDDEHKQTNAYHLILTADVGFWPTAKSVFSWSHSPRKLRTWAFPPLPISHCGLVNECSQPSSAPIPSYGRFRQVAPEGFGHAEPLRDRPPKPLLCRDMPWWHVGLSWGAVLSHECHAKFCWLRLFRCF